MTTIDYQLEVLEKSYGKVSGKLKEIKKEIKKFELIVKVVRDDLQNKEKKLAELKKKQEEFYIQLAIAAENVVKSRKGRIG